MPITRARKEELVAQYSHVLGNCDGFVIVQSKGMTVRQMQDMRATIRGAQGEMLRVKNTLFRIALEQNGWLVPTPLLEGPLNVAFGQGNFPGVAKAVLKFIKDNTLDEKLTVTGGVMDTLLTAPQVEAVSELPSLDELRAQIAGLVVAPATGLVTVLNAATSQVVNVIQAYLDENNKGEGEAA